MVDCCKPPPPELQIKLYEAPQQTVLQKLNPFNKLPEETEFLSEFDPTMHPTFGPPTSTVTKLAIKQKFWSFTGQSMNIKAADGSTWAKIDGKILSLRDRAVIKDADGNPACCVIEKVFALSPAYFVYGFKPYFEGQKPTGETQNNLPLYAWFKIWKKVMALKDVFRICRTPKRIEP